MHLKTLGKNARSAFLEISRAASAVRSGAVLALADELARCRSEIKAANQIDIEKGRQAGLSDALIDRLTLTDGRLDGLEQDLQDLAAMPDPVGEILEDRRTSSGLRLQRVRVPLGVMGVIYESRPNVTIDIAALTLKTGNAAILRGGKETIHSNRILVEVIHKALEKSGLPREAVQFIDSPDRSLVAEMLRLNDYIDVIIPRGGNNLHRFCRDNANIPVITGGIGICHLFVDESADLAAALPLIQNAKTQRPSVCNSLDTLLVHEKVAAEFIPQVVDLLSQDGVTFRAAENAAGFSGHPAVLPAGQDDFDTEWLALVLGLKVVSSMDAAMAHIAAHSTGHSDGILTENTENSRRFIQSVDSAAVFVNASTRFNDGGQFGLGAEVAVSTQRLHARGPMGLPELTTYKWVAIGDYTIRS